MQRFLPAGLLTAAILVTSPAIGEVRDWLFDAFSQGAIRGLAVGFGAVTAGLLLSAALRIRENRLWRYSGLVAVGGLLWLQTTAMGTETPRVDVVEKVHLLEYGLLAYLLYRALLPAGDASALVLPLLGVALAGTAEELVQWLVPRRVGEIRDVGLNVFAGVCGLVFSLSLQPPGPGFRWRRAPWRRIGRWATAAVFAGGLFFYLAHLGYQIEDPAIGRFRSWHTRAELLELSRLRAEEWAADPPKELPIWGVEDYYLTEAAWHCNHRNASYRAGLYALARHADAILERYYAPYLELDGFLGEGRRRWPPWVRAEVEEKVPRLDPAGYESPVLRERIRVRPSKPVFLGAWLAAVAGLALFSRWPRRKTAARTNVEA